MTAEFYLTLLAWISPELVVVFTGLVVLIADLLLPASWKNQLAYASILGLVVALALDRWYVMPMSVLPEVPALPPLLYISPFKSFIKEGILVSSALTIMATM